MAKAHMKWLVEKLVIEELYLHQLCDFKMPFINDVLEKNNIEYDKQVLD